MPELRVPHYDIEQLTPEQAAQHLRIHWGLDNHPIDNMVALLESKGIIVSSFTVGAEKIDAFTQVHREKGNDDQFVVVLGDDSTMARRQFSAAHELGHIVLHKNLESLDSLDKEEKKQIEDQANQFAAAFLLPYHDFFSDLTHPQILKEYLALKRKWKVSIGMMIMRAKQLGKLTYNQYQYLWRQYNIQNWRKSEPLDDIWIVARPQLFKKAFALLKENDIMDEREFVAELSNFGYAMEPKEIEHLLDLDEGTLAIRQSNPPDAIEIGIRTI
jgi:Zn-dependent peptidase ImmA (M78 family)